MLDEELIHSDMKPADLVKYLLETTPDIHSVLDRVASIVEQRNVIQVVQKIKNDGCSHNLEKYLRDIQPLDEQQFRLKITNQIPSYSCNWRCYLPRCLTA